MNAGGLAEGIAESELFGHVKGAFTDARVDRIGCFEMADEGTLFLDEIANMPMRLQAKLLRVLQTGEMARVGSSRVRYVNVRVLSATNADLHAEIAAGRFREDLLYRLNTVVIHLPPLRDRRSDIEALARHFLAIYAARYRKPIAGFEPEASALMQAHGWPGNVRELAHSIERGVLMSDPAATTIAARHLSLRPARTGRRRAGGGPLARGSGARVHRKGAGAAQWRCPPRGGAARHEPQRALPPAAAIWRPRITARENPLERRAGCRRPVAARRAAGRRRAHLDRLGPELQLRSPLDACRRRPRRLDRLRACRPTRW